MQQINGPDNRTSKPFFGRPDNRDKQVTYVGEWIDEEHEQMYAKLYIYHRLVSGEE